jgi:hypothetical protein
MIANLNLSGNTPVSKEWLNMKVRGLLISFIQCFKTLFEIIQHLCRDYDFSGSDDDFLGLCDE